MHELAPFIYYLMFFRLAIIAAGTTSIVLGYFLFIKGVFPCCSHDTASSGQDVHGKFAGVKLTVKNAAPGTCFALFGVAIIVITFITGRPGATIELLEKGKIKATFRGGEFIRAQTLSETALNYLERGQGEKAAETVETALQELASTFNNLAWVLLKTNEDKKTSELLARLAVSVKPLDADALHTMAEITYNKGERRVAIDILNRAQELKPIYSEQLSRWKLSISNPDRN